MAQEWMNAPLVEDEQGQPQPAWMSAPLADAPEQGGQSYASGVFDAATNMFGMGPRLTGAEAALLGRTPEGDWFNYSDGMGERYRAARDAEKGQQAAFREERPVSSAVANIAGDIALPAGAARRGFTLMKNAPRLARQGSKGLAQLAGRSAVEGAGYGALAGAGYADEGQVSEGAVQGAKMGALVGGASPLALQAASRVIPRNLKQAPSLDDLEQAKSAAYREAENLGARYSQGAFDSLVDRIEQRVTALDIDKTTHPKAFRAMERLKERKGQAPTLSQLDKIRQFVSRDVAGALDESEQFFGREMRDEIDDFIDSASATEMVEGSAEQASNAIRKARELNQRYRKAETIEDALVRAEDQTATSGTGGNADNVMRQKVRQILHNKKLSRSFSDEEKALMRKVVRGDVTLNALRTIGRFSPTSGGLMQFLSGYGGVGATAMTGNPLFIAPAIAGGIAKPLADRGTKNAIGLLSATVRRGEAIPRRGLLGPAPDAARTGGLLAGESQAERLRRMQEEELMRAR